MRPVHKKPFRAGAHAAEFRAHHNIVSASRRQGDTVERKLTGGVEDNGERVHWRNSRTAEGCPSDSQYDMTVLSVNSSCHFECQFALISETSIGRGVFTGRIAENPAAPSISAILSGVLGRPLPIAMR